MKLSTVFGILSTGNRNLSTARMLLSTEIHTYQLSAEKGPVPSAQTSTWDFFEKLLHDSNISGMKILFFLII